MVRQRRERSNYGMYCGQLGSRRNCGVLLFNASDMCQLIPCPSLLEDHFQKNQLPGTITIGLFPLLIEPAPATRERSQFIKEFVHFTIRAFPVFPGVCKRRSGYLVIIFSKGLTHPGENKSKN